MGVIPINYVLEVKDLKKSYGQVKAVNGISFKVKQGEIFGLLGPNGAGKTTTINMLTKFIEKDSGLIKINGIDLDQNLDLLQKVGVCNQYIQLWPLLTCEEQLRYIGKMYGMKNKFIKQRADMLLEQVNLKEKRKTLAKNLSGGMQRRLHFIMSIMHDPDIIILDEPEAGLDPQSRVLIREFIKTLKEKKTTLLTTHNMDEAERLVTRVAIIDRGGILEVGTVDELRKQIAPNDTLEVDYNYKVDFNKKQLLNKYAISVDENTLTVSGKNLIGSIKVIIDELVKEVGTPSKMKLRQSTLEDIFIKLTGRRVRE